MKHHRTTLSFLFLFCLSLLLAASAGLAVQHPAAQQGQPTRDPYLTFSITVYQGTGCDCNPIPGVYLNATGRDTDHNDSNLTDDRGYCTLHLQYGKTYRISLETNHFESVLMDVQTIDNQAFTFHLKPLKTDFQTLPSLLARLLHSLQETRQIPN